VFVEHCVNSENEARLESASLPVVTAFAFHIQEAYNALLVVLQDIKTAKLLRAGLEQEEQGEEEELEEELAKREIILGELLRMALKLDYSDEIGRRKVFSVVSLYFPSSLLICAIDAVILRGHARSSTAPTWSH
jgi:condensin complex subunit 3